MAIKNMDVTCPYCGTDFDKPPQRRRKCPACGELVFVKKRCCDRDNAKQLMTQEQANAEEKKWQAYQHTMKLVDDMHRMGFTDSEIQAEQQRSPDKSLSAICALLTVKALKSSSDPHRLQMIHLWLANQLMDIPSARLHHLRKVRYYEIIKYEAQPHPDIYGVRVIAPRNTTPRSETCRQLQGVPFTFSEAKQKMPLPCGEDCGCFYELVFKDEL